MFCYSHTSILFYFGRTFNASWSLHGREKWELTVVMICGSRPHTRRYFLFVCSACVWPGLVSFHLAPRRGKAGIWVCSDYVIIISSVIRRLGNELSFFLSLLSFLCFTCFSHSNLSSHFLLLLLFPIILRPLPTSPSYFVFIFSVVLLRLPSRLSPSFSFFSFSHMHFLLHLYRHLLPDILFSGTFVRKSRIAPSLSTLHEQLRDYCLQRLSRPYPFIFLFFPLSLPTSLSLFLFHFILSSSPPSSTVPSHILPGSSLFPTISFPRSHFLRGKENQRGADPSRVARGDWSWEREMKVSK